MSDEIKDQLINIAKLATDRKIERSTDALGRKLSNEITDSHDNSIFWETYTPIFIGTNRILTPISVEAVPPEIDFELNRGSV